MIAVNKTGFFFILMASSASDAPVIYCSRRTYLAQGEACDAGYAVWEMFYKADYPSAYPLVLFTHDIFKELIGGIHHAHLRTSRVVS